MIEYYLSIRQGVTKTVKKVISLLLAFAVIINIITVFSAGTLTVQAADYAATLKNKGFPESYIDDLVALHNKHPKWIFEPLKTNLNFQTAVNGERKNHSSQLIEKLSGTSSSMYCDCSSCKKNGKYVIQEASNWVSASEKAVKYYMDPRNFLNEKGIFQFESTEYDGTQTKAGVESILKGTWMYNNPISYYNTSGSYVTLKSKITYSDSIMSSASRSGMSAYYLASKIRQENGGATASATAVKGTVSPFQGIYNYYNIGAYTGAMDGLAWAAGFLKLNKNSTLYSSYDSSAKKTGGTKTSIKSGQYMTWRANCGNYFHVRLYNEGNGYTEGKNGYVLKSDVRTTYIGDTGSGWGRPWYSPHLSILYGAKYIAQDFKTQNTGYLQKFNVTPKANTLYTHEYMANVAAAAAESSTTYNAYKNANILDVTKTFYIPVYNNMPNDNTSDNSTTTNKNNTTTTNKNNTTSANNPSVGNVTGLKVKSADLKSITLSWNSVKGVTGYRVELYKNGKYSYYGKTTKTTYTVSGLASCKGYKIRVKAYKAVSGKNYFCKNWAEVSYATRATRVSKFRATGSNNSAIYLAWNKKSGATGYNVYKYDKSKKKYLLYKTVKGSNNTTLKVSGLKNNTKYQFKIYAYLTYNGKTYNGYCSNAISYSTKYNMVTINKVSSSKSKQITVKWNKPWYACSGYQVMWSTTRNFSSNYKSVYVSGQKNLSTTLKTAQSKKYYYVRVRAYKTVNSKKTYCSWSGVKKIRVK